MHILAFFTTPGWIFGPAILLSGILALVVCFKTSRVGRSTQDVRRALLYSLLPLGISILGALVGIVVVLASAGALEKGGGWWAVGATCLDGLIVTVIPLIWSLLLFPSRGMPLSPEPRME